MQQSSSHEQQSVEHRILAELNAQRGLRLESSRLQLSGSTHVQIDGLDESKRVACEVYAHVGRLKGSQPDKVASDILKLNLVEKIKGGEWKKIVCFGDPDAARKFEGRSWLARAATEFDIEIVVVRLSDEERAVVKEAQRRQKMVNDEL